MHSETLKKLGYHVNIIHERHKDFGGIWGNKPLVRPRGGRTIAVITNQDRSKIFSGVAICSPADNYCKKEGARIALERAIIQAMGELNG